MERRHAMKFSKACIAAATAVTALGSAFAPQRADADVYPAVRNASDTWQNYSARTTSTTAYFINGNDNSGSATGFVERYNGPGNNLQGVRVHMTTSGGSNYIKGFVRCQQNENTTIKKAVYTNYDVTADTTKWTSWCHWLDEGARTHSRIGWGAVMATVDTSVTGVIRPVGEFNTISQNVRVSARVAAGYPAWVNVSARPAISFDAAHPGIYTVLGPIF
jgi:hypothetical protein